MSLLKRITLFAAALLAGPATMVACGNVNLKGDWSTADRSSSGLAPHPAEVREAVVQVYAARAFKWRGALGVHTWIAVKPTDAEQYTVHQVMGWRGRRGLPVVVSIEDVPDRNWYGARPELLADLRGPPAATAIPRIEAAIASYPYDREYSLWPGPNSNTFTAHVGREVPELAMDLPTTAIGKDFLTNGNIFESAPSGTGGQISIYGVLGITVARQEGFELNVLALNFGLDLLRPAIKLPGVGRLGMSKTPGDSP